MTHADIRIIVFPILWYIRNEWTLPWLQHHISVAVHSGVNVSVGLALLHHPRLGTTLTLDAPTDTSGRGQLGMRNGANLHWPVATMGL